MTNKNSIKLILLFISSAISFSTSNCTGSYGLDYYHLFDENLVLSQENEPKKFNLWYFPNEFKKENNSVDLNIKEWSLFLEGKYQEEDLIKIMYRRDGFKGQDNELKVLQSKTSKPRQIAQKEKEFIQYLDYALELENYLKTLVPDSWDEKPIVKDPAEQNRMLAKANKLLAQFRSGFTKERMHYQLIKLHRYYGSYEEVVDIYESYFKNKKSFISYWAMDQYAGVLRIMKRNAASNYYFSKVYMECPSKRRSAYLSIDIKSEREFEDAKNMGASPDELMSLHFIRGMNGKNLGLYDLSKITEINQNSDFARILMSREINRLETFFLNNNKTYYPSYGHEGMGKLVKQKTEGKYLERLIALNENLLQNDSKSQFWHLSMAYLYFLNGDYDKSSIMANQIHGLTENDQVQLDILNVLLYVKMRPVLSVEDQNKVGEQLYKINKGEVYYNSLQSREFSFSLNEYLFDELSSRSDVKDNAFLTLIFGGRRLQTDLYIDREYYIEPLEKVTVSYLDKVLMDLKETPQTKLVEYASSNYFSNGYYWSGEDRNIVKFDDVKFFIRELRALLLMRNPDRLEEAASEFNKIPLEIKSQISNTQTAVNPFTFYIKDPYFEDYGYDYENSVPDEMKFTRTKVVNSLVRLHSKAKRKNSAEDYFNLGLAYYNMSYYGVSWKLMGNYRSSSGLNGFYDMAVPKQFFDRALNIGTLNREMTAKAHYMLARCDQNRYCEGTGIRDNYTNYYGVYNDYFDQFQSGIRSSGFRKDFEVLKNQYSNTKFYQELIRECKYFDYYVSRF